MTPLRAVALAVLAVVAGVAPARDLAREADRRLAAGAAPAAMGPRFLEAIWRYYNLVDFAVGQRDPRASVAMRLAYDDAETLTRPAAAASDPARLRASFGRVAPILSGLIDARTTPPQRRYFCEQ